MSGQPPIVVHDDDGEVIILAGPFYVVRRPDGKPGASVRIAGEFGTYPHIGTAAHLLAPVNVRETIEQIANMLDARRIHEG